MLGMILMGGLAMAKPVDRVPYEPAGQAAVKPGAAPQLVAMDRLQRFDRDRTPQTASLAAIDLHGWRGERVWGQAIAVCEAGVQELRLEPLTLRGPAGATLPAELNVVRYTQSNGKLVGDILDGTARTAFTGVTRPVTVTVDIPADAAPGLWEGTLAASLNGARLTVPVRLEVAPEVLPPPAEWKCHLDLWQHPDAVARWHDVPKWSDAHFAHLRPYMRRLASMGQKTITATLIDEAWDHQTYDDFGAMIAVTRRADGTWAYDYSVFDRWVTFMTDEIGLRNASINCYGMIPWSLRFAYFDEAQNRRVAPQMTPDSETYEAFWGSLLTDFVRHLREKGWENRTYLAMDERPDHLFRPALAVIRKYAPTLKVAAACNAPSAITEDFDDCSYGLNIAGRLLPLASGRRDKGKLTTFYICCTHAHPNTFMHNTLAEAEWLLPYASACGLDGMLRWTFQSWVENPFVCQDYVRWPSGDTSMLYPGDRSSLRWEAFRDGVETFEKIRILREKAAALKRPEALAPLNDALGDFRLDKPAAWEADLQKLDAALRTTAQALR